MYLLSIESSCDETAAAVVRAEDGRLTVLSDVVASQVDTHRLFGGVVPEIASRAHAEVISSVTYRALSESGVRLSDVDAVAVTDHPGLIGALLVGVNFAKSLAYSHGIPLVAVDHIKGHIAAAYYDKEPPKPPFLSFVVSGGHTAIYHVRDYTDVLLIGGTRDDAMGEAFDKVGRLLGLPYPAGAGFDALATEGFFAAVGQPVPEGADGEHPATVSAARRFPKTEAAKELALPTPALPQGTLDFSFSGPKTAAVNLLHRYEQVGKRPDRALFAAAYTHTVTEAAAKKLSEAMDRYPGLPLVLAGGVAANSHLRAALSSLSRERGVRLVIPPRSLCGDNGAMIAAQGYYEFLAGHRAEADLNASALD
ncbi:MAG: tRNA (adenosine(37)-N6)-threonylcarbamoyltransferase complex transferase subunit TsaD [Clostridia bacterium]|nr:tRNA (adenosine(37)-N6)-threonylcarbamoyltransferase complex transferase subunit TsaD [Clostridia bacterium]